MRMSSILAALLITLSLTAQAKLLVIGDTHTVGPTNLTFQSEQLSTVPLRADSVYLSVNGTNAITVNLIADDLGKLTYLVTNVTIGANASYGYVFPGVTNATVRRPTLTSLRLEGTKTAGITNALRTSITYKLYGTDE